jgi:Family of unknown function (DUF6508)
MKSRMPTSNDIEELVSFLPRLYAEGFTPITRWHVGIKDQDGVLTMPWPEYDELVGEFFRVASRECWSDYDYRPEDASLMLESDDILETADLAQIKTLLTYCVRGERFCDGHWGAMIEEGHIRRLLQRLAELGSTSARQKKR